MLSFFPRDVLDEIWDLVGSVSEGFPMHSSINTSFIFDIFSFTKNLRWVHHRRTWESPETGMWI